MRKIVYYIASSIDGFIASKRGSIEGFLMEGEHADAFLKALNNYDTVIMGKNTYEFGFQFGLQPGQPAYKGLKHIIVSKSLKFENTKEVELISSNEIEYIQKLKEQSGKDIWLCGGGHLAGFLLKNGLIDDITLKVNPIILGDGIKLFEGFTQLLEWEYFDSHTYNNGVVLQSYRKKK